MNKAFILVLAFILSLGLIAPSIIFAQEDTTTEIADEIVDEIAEEATDITADELEISEPGGFGWLKRFTRNIQIVFTRDQVKKAELELKNAAEDIYRVKWEIEKNPNDEKIVEKIEKFNGKYKRTMEKIDARLERVKAENPENPELKKFLDKYTEHRLKHIEILENISEKVPEDIKEEITKKREEHIKRLGEVMQKLQSKEEIKTRLRNTLNQQENNALRQTRRLEIINKLEDISPEIKLQIEELKQENKTIIQGIRSRNQEALKDLKQFRTEVKSKLQENKTKLKSDPEARLELRQEIRTEHQDLLKKNFQIHQQNIQEVRQIRQNTKSTIKDTRNSKQ